MALLLQFVSHRQQELEASSGREPLLAVGLACAEWKTGREGGRERGDGAERRGRVNKREREKEGGMESGRRKEGRRERGEERERRKGRVT